MIEKFELSELLIKYGLNTENILKNNENILTYGEYNDIDDTLDYLINILKISKTYVEKCPSILYMNVGEIKDNVKFLKETDIKFSSVESCLHVLSTDSNQLIDTYDYVLKNYGIEIINKVTSILAVPKERIIGIENLNIPNIRKQDIISISIGSNTIDDIKAMINSEEFKKYPELFTSTTLAHSSAEKIKEMINSEEFKKYPELFTSTTLAHSSAEKIKEMINSEEFKKYPELFTSTTLALSSIEDIRLLLGLSYWQEEKYRRLLTSTILANSKSMIKKIPKLIKMAEEYGIDEYLTTNFLRHSPSQNYALIRYLIDNEIPLITYDHKKGDYKLNSIFSKAPSVLKKDHEIDIKELMEKYPYKDARVLS